MSKPRILIVHPDDDISRDLFSAEGCLEKMTVEAVGYKDGPRAAKNKWDFLYIRGPFVQADFDSDETREHIDETIRQRGQAYSVDNIQSYTDILLEDKWRQYELFGELMPVTKVVNSFEEVDFKNQLVKKRISGRSRDIHFDPDSLQAAAEPGDYIVQQRLNIATEYRAFMVGEELILPLEIKSSKTEKTKNQVLGAEPTVPKEVKSICRQVANKLSFDLMGLDIAKTEDGFHLLEVNRSPQFRAFLELTGINLASKLLAYLLEY